MSDLQPFDLCGPLPTGTTLLEASAGTGKTWTIGALVTRYVAEGVATLEQMLIVTFGRAASQELRERVRGQLVEAERWLAAPEPVTDQGALAALLLDAPEGELVRRRQRLRDALGAFDGATIATTHQFCHLVLRSLGVAGDTDANASLVEDLEDLLGEVVDDLYLRRFGDLVGVPPFSHADALRLGRAAAGDPQARLQPGLDEVDLDTVPGQRVAFAWEVREELDRRKRRLGVLSYDDLLSQLADALVDDDAPARQRMRRRWSIVLVDEFQDTDPVQWQVLDRAFTGHATMVLIGDPKQAIYAFRGGDVTTYLQAAGTATTRQTLARNWRSDSDLVDSLQTVLREAALGDEQIVVRDVQAHHQGSRLAGAGAPFRLRVVRKDVLGLSATAKPSVHQIRPHLYDDVARDIKRLLTSGATFEGERLQPRDVAVLAHKNNDLQLVQRALASLGVPAVVAGSGSVFGTPAATEWLRLLEALEQPHRSARVRSAALTSFFGHTAVELDTQGDDLTDRVAGIARDWTGLLVSRGVAAVLEAAVTAGLTARVLSRVDGERLLTDLRHVGQSLHQVATDERFGVVALLTWLRAQMADDKVEVASERTRRLDSDAAAVQLVTIHGSKGLEYPVVYLPTLWDRYPQDPPVPRFHADPDAGAHRCIDVSASGPQWQDHLGRARAEEDGESLRLLYVAMTRARSQVVAWWAPAARNAPAAPLHRLLFGRRPGWSQVPPQQPVHSEDDVVRILDAWQDSGGPVWEEARRIELVEGDLPADDRPLAARRFRRFVDTAWRRTSYSSLSAAAAAAQPAAGAVGSEPEEPPKSDEPDVALDPAAVLAPSPDAVPSPMAHLPVGATFGSLVHAVLEHADPDAVDCRAELLRHIHEQLVRWPVAVDTAALADALVQVCATPLGPLADGATLRGIPLRDRLREMEFELPLAGGDVRDYPAAPVTLGDVAPLLRRHLPVGDPLLAYADALGVPSLGGQDLRGYLTGSVDVVLRVPAGGTSRYLVVDYKTNWLGGYDNPLTSDAYRPEALDAAMGHSDYPLQALLYAVVLHRFLRWRQPGYDPAVHLGGVLYLYLRGMCGPATPFVDEQPCGVFSWQPPAALVEALSGLLDGSAT
ncbi:MAG TPA: UvrD-helicase domain-containing protein [Nocardioidaceae bacterium]|nr:UvrD-helicase domain-containing protein [Nocardioidaceae bacterium]